LAQRRSRSASIARFTRSSGGVALVAAERDLSQGIGATSSEDEYVEFAHGTTVASARDIARHGLSERRARRRKVWSYQPGSFYTVLIDPYDVQGSLEYALSWGTRHAGSLAVLKLRLPRAIVEIGRAHV